MRVKILAEAFYETSLFGVGLSKGVTSGMEYEEFIPIHHVVEYRDGTVEDYIEQQEKFNQMSGVAEKLAPLNHGHNKCLYQMMLCLDCTFPRYMWQESDQYKFNVTQSESTMHTIHTKPFTQDMFQDGDVPDVILSLLNNLRNEYLVTKDKETWRKIIKLKPESFLQRRIMTCNYRSLREMLHQRKGHRLVEWEWFIQSVKEQCRHPELLP